MPTGYTADIKNGITFNEFAWNCARAFGALITMRDAPADAPIPEKFEADPYYANRLTELTAERDRIARLTAEEAETAAKADYEQEHAQIETRIEKLNKLRQDYDDMLKQVLAWPPPTADHYRLKTFMIEQLKTSIEGDCDTGYYERNLPVRLNGKVWKADKRQELDSSIKRAWIAKQEEETRAANRTAWVRALRESLEETR